MHWLFADGNDTANTDTDTDDNDDDDAGSGNDGVASDGNTGGDGGGGTNLPKTQAELDALLTARVKRAKRAAAKELRDALREEVKAELAAANADESKDAKIARLQKDVERLKDLELLAEVAEERYDDELAGLPEHIRAMAPDDDEDIVVKEAWLVKAKKAATKYRESQSNADDTKDGDTKATGGNPAKRGNTANDPKNGKADVRTPVEKLLERAKKNPAYRM